MTLLLIAILLISGLCSLSSSVPRQFHVVKEQKTWTEAQQYCREEFTDLATIDDMTEMEQVKRMMQEAGVGKVWIGLHQGSEQGSWEWSDGSSSSFHYWGTAEPSYGTEEFCVEIRHVVSGQWNDVVCHHLLSFICYEDPIEVKRQIVRVELQVASHVNIHDPAVQQAFLQQIQQRLRDSGMPADAKLTWKRQPDGKIFKEKEKKEEGRKRMKRN